MIADPIDRQLGDIDGFAAPQRWAVLALAWSALTISTVCRLAWGSVAIPVSQSLDLPFAVLGTFVTAFYCGYVASNVVGGIVTDSLGGRIALTVSLVSLAIATFGFGYTPSLTVGLALQVLMGFAAGADYSAGVKLVSGYFPRRERGRAIGLLMSASSSAVIITNAILPSVVAACGWRNGYHGLGAAVLVIAVLCMLFIPDTRITGEAEPQKGACSLFRHITSANFILLSIAGTGAFWGTLGLMAWAIPLMVKEHGLTTVQAGFVIAIAGVAGLFSKPLIGWLSDKFGGRRKALSILSFGFFATILVLFGQLKTLTAFEFAAPLIGIGAFVYSPLLVAMVAEGAGTKLAGSAAGIANAIWQLGSAIAPAAIGILFQRTQSFSMSFAALAAGPLLAVILMLFVRDDQAETVEPNE